MESMSWIIRDYKCDCGNDFEELLDRTEPKEVACPVCGVVNSPVLSCPSIATFSLMDKQSQTHHLKERSRKHTEKLVKQNQ